jgi:hypothetical protein
LVSTPGNVARLPPAPRVDLVALPLPRVDGLPDGAESTNSIPQEKHSFLFQAFDGLAAPFAEFLAAACADERRRPDWIIVDIFHHWVAAAALEHKVPSIPLPIPNRYSNSRFPLGSESQVLLGFSPGAVGGVPPGRRGSD